MIQEKANKNIHNYPGTIVQLIKFKKKKDVLGCLG